MKKIISCLSILLVLTALTICMTFPTASDDATHSGTWGNLSWTFNETTGELIISGTGEMKDFYSSEDTNAWRAYKFSIKSIIIDEGVTSIGRYAFYCCEAVTSITLPMSLKRIQTDAFSYCSHSLTSISVAEENTRYHVSGKCLIDTHTKTLVLGCKDSEIPSDGSVSKIGIGAFSGCSELSRITIPSSVITIGSRAFDACSGLDSVIILDGLTNIGDYAFAHCDYLEFIAIPSSVTRFGNNVLHNTVYSSLLYCGTVDTWKSISNSDQIPGSKIIYHTSHTYSAWQKTDSHHQRNCICGDSQTADHIYGDWVKKDSVQHQRKCDECGYIQVIDHTWNAGEINTPATHLELGIKTFTCSDCGEIKTEDIAKLTDHIFGPWEQCNAQQHKRSCPCGEAVEYMDHTYDNDKDASCNDCGDVREIPSGCGATLSSGFGLTLLLIGAAFGVSRKRKKQ